MLSSFPGFRKFKLAYRFSFAFLGIIMVLGILTYQAIDSIVTKTLHEQHKLRGVAIASNLASNAIDLLLVDNISQVQLLLKNTQKTNQEIAYIFIIDPKGKVPAHTLPGGFPDDLRKMNQHQLNQSYSSQLIETEKGILLDVSVPILHGSSGYVHIGFSRKIIDQKLGAIQQRIFFIFILACVAACILAIFISQRIAKPLAALAQGAEKIRQRNYSHRVANDSSDELGVVTNAFNQMASSLEEDIEKLIKAEKDVAAETERLAVTLRSIGDGVITTDVSGDIVLLNKVAENLTGWSNEEAAGRPLEEVFQIVNGQTGGKCENPVTRVVNSGQIVGLATHTILSSRDGRERRIADSGAPILDVKSKIIGVVLVFRDVTEQIKMEKELLKVKKLESVGVLAGGIAHDFNNILAAILGNINLALLDADLKDKTRERLSNAEKASIRAKDLTQQLLTFSKGGEPVKKASSLENVIKDSANFVLHGDKVACKYNMPGDLFLVDIDKGQISQVIQNIVQNANHAMPKGGTITITCENVFHGDSDTLLSAKRRYVKISIQDEGIGMPADAVEKIFDPYFSTKHDGSGLGLAITHSIVSKHFGHISVESSPGVGTTFTVFLPASDQTVVQTQKHEVLSKASSRAKILVMDDDEMVRTLSRDMLMQLGHGVELSENGEEAIEMYQASVNTENKYDLIIMDLTVPGGMGGKEAVKKILAIDSNAKVIVSSGYSTDPIMANFKDYGFCSAITKPYQIEELSRVISQVID